MSEHSQENSPQNSDENVEKKRMPKKLIDQAGETVFQNIYKDVQNEIKDEIITKLLYKLEEKGKKIEELEKEKRKLKDDYTHVLKRILKTQNDFTLQNNPNNIHKKNISMGNENSSRFNNSAIITHKKNHVNISEEWDASEEDSLDNKNKYDKKNIDNKIKKYFNNLNKKNYVNNTDGTSTEHFIEKDVDLCDELFPRKSNNEINVSFEGFASGTKRNTSAKNRKPQIRLYFKEYKNSILDKKDDSNKNRSTMKKKIKIYKGGNNPYLKNTNTARNKKKNNNIYYNYTSEKKRSTERKIANQNNKGNYKKTNVVNSNDPNRKLKLNYALGNKAHTYYLTKQSTK